MGDRTPARWRRPALAPIYGAVIAFGAVFLASFVVGPEVRVTVEAEPIPAGLVVEILDDDEQLLDSQPADADGHWSALVAPAARQVCLRPPAGWSVVDQACQPVSADVRFRLART